MEKEKELNLDELETVTGGYGDAINGSGSGNNSAPAPSSGNNSGSDTTLPGITFKNK